MDNLSIDEPKGRRGFLEDLFKIAKGTAALGLVGMLEGCDGNDDSNNGDSGSAYASGTLRSRGIIRDAKNRTPDEFVGIYEGFKAEGNIRAVLELSTGDQEKTIRENWDTGGRIDRKFARSPFYSEAEAIAALTALKSYQFVAERKQKDTQYLSEREARVRFSLTNGSAEVELSYHLVMEYGEWRVASRTFKEAD